VYILHSRNYSKRVEGNAGQILDEGPRIIPIYPLKTVFFAVFRWRFFL